MLATRDTHYSLDLYVVAVEAASNIPKKNCQ